jgi:hypothetical protein
MQSAPFAAPRLHIKIGVGDALVRRSGGQRHSFGVGVGAAR